ncbi:MULTISPECIES: hypothetical protein [Roseivirga]|uniref:Uncharacterized protein n=1 Tax=Roseivirga spongicola TaxID=333140 RepID=A0A150XEU0_9BACT|nr:MULTISPECIES: hypothetical protein [Roseivirga]KYG77221.1 hypothetical protein AWW68_00180 [Roseivirga spongicola]MBO6496600.1 hypothetical protein [Roseivirga sp.]MBO6662695.1 hypothetical protein [Roseivirga sp.]MBO6760828.1 hypothetical protein [Roseivirga sp.]MBO6909702.1 hypothetical protein [Roseivirga sp.]
MKKSFFKRLFNRGKNAAEDYVLQDLVYADVIKDYAKLAEHNKHTGIPVELTVAQALLDLEEFKISFESKHLYWSTDKQKEVDRTLEKLTHIKENAEAFINSELKSVPDSMFEAIDKANTQLAELKAEKQEIRDLSDHSKTQDNE